MKVLKTLKKIGLTEYESKIYLTLIKHGTQTAKEISKKSKVPKNRIYDSVEFLKERCLIEEIIGTPKKYKAINPKIALSEYLKSLEKLEENLELLYKKPKEKTKIPIKIIYGKKSAYEARFFDFDVVKEKMSVIVGLEHITTPKLGMIDRECKNATDRGVKIKFLLNMDYEENRKKAEFMSKFGIKYKNFPAKNFVLAIIDEKIMRIEIPDPEKKRINIWIENEDLARNMQKFFDQEWNKRR